jgi:hypothetical protein
MPLRSRGGELPKHQFLGSSVNRALRKLPLILLKCVEPILDRLGDLVKAVMVPTGARNVRWRPRVKPPAGPPAHAR